MASTIIIYEGDGTRTDFTIPFDYLKKAFVTVRLGPVNTLTGGDYGDTGSDYYFLDKTTIRLKVAPASGESLTIRRYTSATERVVTFKDASILKATDLDTSQVQAFHIAEEGRDAINDAIIGDKEGNWDAKGHRIINVGDPIKDNDAVNLEYYKKDAEGAYQARLNAEKARDASKASEIKSTQEADRAESEADRAKVYAGQAYAGQIQADWNQTDSTQKDYIKNKPTIPTKTSQLTNDSGFLISNDVKPMIPTKTSQLTNDSGFLISSNVKPALPMGHLFAWPYQTPPDGAIQCNGATYDRALYMDFFDYAMSKGWVKTESEWQSIASASGGYCPYYSQGNGSTTFRTPKFAPFMQIAIAGSSAGNYHRAGLPNISGRSDLGGIYSSFSYSGALYTEWDAGDATGATHVNAGSPQRVKITFSASNSSSVYGRSSTVQPESNEWMICVVVAGQATNIGSVDVGNVMSAVAQVQASVSVVEAKPILNAKAYITETWSNGTSWYRKYSDGWIEQGGEYTKERDTNSTVTFPVAFKDTNYTISTSQYSRLTSSEAPVCDFTVKTNTGFAHNYASWGGKTGWVACGY